jgi:hypothetical protein
MSYRANWLTHMLATVTGRGFDEDLARDFWRGRPDLWNSTQHIPYRWLKFFLVYAICVLAQLTAPVAVVALFWWAIRQGEHDWLWWLFGITLGTAAGLVGALLAATSAYLRVWGRSKAERRSLERAIERGADVTAKAVGALFWIVTCPP